MHGGATVPAGPGHHAYRSGKFSKAFGRFAAAVEAAIEDPDLLDARRGVAAALAALEQAGERLEARDTPEFRSRAVDLFEEAMETLKADAAAGIVKLRELGALLQRGVSEDSAFRVVVQRADSYRVAVNDAVRLKLSASTAMSLADIAAALDGLVQEFADVAGVEAASEAARRFDVNRLGGRLARAGLVLGARRGD